MWHAYERFFIYKKPRGLRGYKISVINKAYFFDLELVVLELEAFFFFGIRDLLSFFSIIPEDFLSEKSQLQILLVVGQESFTLPQTVYPGTEL